MKITDAISAYDFLSKIHWLGFIFLAIVIGLLIAYFAYNISIKLFESKVIHIGLSLGAFTAIFICLMVLKFEARQDKSILDRANIIKTYMLENNESQVGFKELANNVDFTDELSCKIMDTVCTNNRIDEFKKIINNFTDEFAITDIPLGSYKNDFSGIKLIDEKVLKLYHEKNQKLSPLFKEKILYYMRKSNIDTLNFQFINNCIDRRCDNNLLDFIIAKYPRLFVSIYAPYNIYDKNNHDLSISEALIINPDTVNQILNRKIKLKKNKLN